MHEQLLLAASKLTTDALFERIKALAFQERGATVELVAHLAELIGRRTDLGDGWGPVYEHCRPISVSPRTPPTTASPRRARCGASR